MEGMSSGRSQLRQLRRRFKIGEGEESGKKPAIFIRALEFLKG